MKKLMLLVAVATFALGTAAYAGGNEKSCAEKKSCCKAGGAKACGKAGESKSCHGKDDKAMGKSSTEDVKTEKAASTKESAK